MLLLTQGGTHTHTHTHTRTHTHAQAGTHTTKICQRTKTSGEKLIEFSRENYREWILSFSQPLFSGDDPYDLGLEVRTRVNSDGKIAGIDPHFHSQLRCSARVPRPLNTTWASMSSTPSSSGALPGEKLSEFSMGKQHGPL